MPIFYSIVQAAQNKQIWQKYIPSRQISPVSARLRTLLPNFKEDMYLVLVDCFFSLEPFTKYNSKASSRTFFCFMSFSKEYASASSISAPDKTELILSVAAKAVRRSPKVFTRPWTYNALSVKQMKEHKSGNLREQRHRELLTAKVNVKVYPINEATIPTDISPYIW